MSGNEEIFVVDCFDTHEARASLLMNPCASIGLNNDLVNEDTLPRSTRNSSLQQRGVLVVVATVIFRAVTASD